MNAFKVLVVNADDFGFTCDVNEGIVEAHRRGIVTSATLMANGAAFEHAVALARENPDLDVGAHLTLIGGASVWEPGRSLPPSLGALLAAVLSRRLRPYEEFAAQVRRIREAGLEISHADTHKHTHLLPQVARAVARVCRESRIRWVRRPVGLPVLSSLSSFELAEAGVRMTDFFLGYRETGSLDEESLERLLRGLKPGASELMCHPGYLREPLRAAKTRLKDSRARELAALTSECARRVIREEGIVLANYRELSRLGI